MSFNSSVIYHSCLICQRLATKMSFFVDHSRRNFSDVFPILYQNRYCDQEDFSIAVFGGENDKNYEQYDRPFLLNNFDIKIYVPSVLKQKNGCKAVASGSDIYLTDYKNVSD